MVFLVRHHSQAIEFEGEKEATTRCLEIIAEGPQSPIPLINHLPTSSFIGGCDVDASYSGPKLPFLEDDKFGITPEFVHEMIQWFKDGKTLPRRYVWEIVLGAWTHFSNEESLVDLKLDEGMTVDVIGDVHGRRMNSLWEE